MALETMFVIAALTLPAATTRYYAWTRQSVHVVTSAAVYGPSELAILDLPPASSTDLMKGMSFTDKFVRLIERMDEYSLLQDGWDGDDSLAPNHIQIAAARELIGKFPSGVPTPAPMISARGLIGFFWDEEHFFADIDIDRSGVISYFCVDRDSGQETYVEGLESVAAAIAAIGPSLAGLCSSKQYNRFALIA